MTAVQDAWVAEAIDLRAQGLSERAIAEAVGKAASTVHSALAKAATAESAEPGAEAPEPSSNGSGSNGNGKVDAETAARLAAAAGGSSAEPRAGDDGATPGQQTIDGGEVQAAAPRPEEIVVRGTMPLDFFNAGGKLPNKASLKFIGGKVGLEAGTAFKKSDVVKFEGYATVVGTLPRDKRDRSTGIVIECELQILAEIDDLRLTS